MTSGGKYSEEIRSHDMTSGGKYSEEIWLHDTASGGKHSKNIRSHKITSGGNIPWRSGHMIWHAGENIPKRSDHMLFLIHVLYISRTLEVFRWELLQEGESINIVFLIWERKCSNENSNKSLVNR
jgi:hypothetical protein